MLHLTDIPSLRAYVREQKSAGRAVGFVPTMGALHEGHLKLVDEARKRAGRVVMSVFVNPLQFGQNEDLAKYPRDLPRDATLADRRGVDLLFAPTVEVMYPPGAETRVSPGPTASYWEGSVRPGHFTGVLTVVSKLFHLVQPDVAVFGQKDIQQFTLIRKMVRDLDLPVELVMVPTVREADGLAMSSRNAYLSAEERRDAAYLSAGLRAAHQAWQKGQRDPSALEALLRAALARSERIRPDYIATVEPERLTPAGTAGAGTILMVAARVGTTRLIDNMIYGQGVP
ncbi:MAG TPA: pantoate--beta-alanine ligase [Gemmatimonadales bacterium]|nr:pantoate--beta-alanine ligase [Gemmatimonadales bacterium]